jgi:hypothetical protein
MFCWISIVSAILFSEFHTHKINFFQFFLTQLMCFSGGIISAGSENSAGSEDLRILRLFGLVSLISLAGQSIMIFLHTI